MLRIIWNILSFDQKVILSIFIFWRAHMRASWRAHYLKFHQILDIDLKFMSMKFCWQIIFSLEDITNHVTKSQNHKMAPTWRHAWMISIKIVWIQLHDMINDHGNFHVDWIMITYKNALHKIWKKERRINKE